MRWLGRCSRAVRSSGPAAGNNRPGRRGWRRAGRKRARGGARRDPVRPCRCAQRVRGFPGPGGGVTGESRPEEPRMMRFPGTARRRGAGALGAPARLAFLCAAVAIGGGPARSDGWKKSNPSSEPDEFILVVGQEEGEPATEPAPAQPTPEAPPEALADAPPVAGPAPAPPRGPRRGRDVRGKPPRKEDHLQLFQNPLGRGADPVRRTRRAPAHS
jgi:hypothetical protein